MAFQLEPGIRKRLAFLASFVAAAIGLFLASFQVQGAHMPHDVALAVYSLLGLMIVAGVAAFVWELVKVCRRYLKHRETSAEWVLEEPPGLLDYVPDGIRANEKFTDLLNTLSDAAVSFNRTLDRHTRRVERSAGASPERRQGLANRTARAMERNADVIHDRLVVIEATVKEIARNTEGFISSATPTTAAELTSLRTFHATLVSTHNITVGTLASLADYRKSVQTLEDQNLARTVRLASRRLGAGLDGIVTAMRQKDADTVKLARSLEHKLDQAEKALTQP